MDRPGTTSGGGGRPAGPGGAEGPDTFACDPQAKPPEANLRRLTMAQYRNTLASIAAFAMSDASTGAEVVASLADPLRLLPDDQREPVPEDLHGSYRRLDQALQQEHVDGFYAVGAAMGAALTAPQRIARAVGACATDADASNDEACLDAFIARFGSRVLRRPLTTEEAAFYRTVYGTNRAPNPRAYADVIALLLNAPQFLYFVEHGGRAASQPDVYEVSAFELASRLSYQFWQTMPDDELWGAASDGSLMNDDVYQKQVERLYQDARTQPTIREFIADWLKTEDLPALDAHNTDPTFKAFAGKDLPGGALRQQMIDDVVGMVDYHVWQKRGSVDDLLTSNASFHRGPDLAKIYGVAPWDGAGRPPAFADGERPGLLTRALFLSSGSANTRPIMKGVFIRRRLLCDEIPPPPPGANAVPPELRPDMTTREVVEVLTEKKGTVCASCHKLSINPLGFATEGFDALGRPRTEQRLFDESGAEIGKKSVDTSSTPRVTSGDTTPSNGPGDLAELIASSGKANACLARNYFRFTYARWENLDVDGCQLESLRKRLENRGAIGDLLKEIALAPLFRQRAFR